MWLVGGKGLRMKGLLIILEIVWLLFKGKRGVRDGLEVAEEAEEDAEVE